MLGSKLGRFMLLAVAVTVAAPQPSHAQLGGLIKKKMAEKAKKTVKGEEPAAEAGATPISNDADVLIMTKPVLDGFEKGLRTEIALRDELKAELASKKTQAQYEACKQEAMSSPEGAKIVEVMGSIPENATAEETQRIMTKMGKDAEALMLKKCGEDPVNYGDSWRAKRIAEIEQKAAAAAGPIESSGFDNEPSAAPVAASESDAVYLPGTATPQIVVDAAFEGISARAYSILKERVIALCQWLAAQGGSYTPSGPIVTFPGTGNVKWVFTSAEVAALQPLCKLLTGLIGQVT